MFCSLREDNPGKSTEQLIFEFYQEMQENWLDMFSMLMFKSYTRPFLNFALQQGYTDIFQLLENIDLMLMKFFEEEWYENKITEVDNCDFKQYPNHKVS
ncbi:MAG: hypothetical protein P9L91_01815 [Candidatus Zophobacter franzmannii]|nr:hypothetical protein [Candidatus Zophobacter franzmannii]